MGYRLFFKFYSLLFSLVGLAAAATAAGWDLPLNGLERALVDPGLRLAVGVGGGLVFLIGIVVLVAGAFKSPKETFALVRNNDLGYVHISLGALESLIDRISRKVEGVKDVRPRIRSTAEGVAVFLQIHVLPDIEIPAVSSELQEKVSSELEKKAGIQVLEVRVLVDSVTSTSKSKPRVE